MALRMRLLGNHKLKKLPENKSESFLTDVNTKNDYSKPTFKLAGSEKPTNAAFTGREVQE